MNETNRVPRTDIEAIGRVGELITTSGIDGLVGSVYANVEQLKQALADCGWTLEAPIYGESTWAVTWIGQARKRERAFKIVLNSYGDRVEVCNCWMLNGDKTEKEQPEGLPQIFNF